jgi:hydrogenase maturation protein HypF
MEAMAHEFGAQHGINALSSVEPFAYEIDATPDKKTYQLNWSFLGEMAEEKQRGTTIAELAFRFHLTVVDSVCDILKRLAAAYDTDRVIISGGTFQNRFLLENITGRLLARNMVPYVHRQVPTNDGGLALGQIILAN